MMLLRHSANWNPMKPLMHFIRNIGHGKRAANAIANHRAEMGSQQQPDRWALFRNMLNDVSWLSKY